MSYLRRWTVRTDPLDLGQPFWFYVYVYETPEELRKAAAKYRHDDEGWEGTVGCFQPQISCKVDKKGNSIRTASTTFIGVMRLCVGHMQQFVIIHESTHAAINLVRAMAYQNGRSDPDFEDINVEEALCYATHEISRSLLYKSRQRG